MCGEKAVDAFNHLGGEIAGEIESGGAGEGGSGEGDGKDDGEEEKRGEHGQEWQALVHGTI